MTPSMFFYIMFRKEKKIYIGMYHQHGALSLVQPVKWKINSPVSFSLLSPTVSDARRATMFYWSICTKQLSF